MRRSPPEIDQTAVQAALAARKSLETVPFRPKVASSGNIGAAEGVIQTFLDCLTILPVLSP